MDVNKVQKLNQMAVYLQKHNINQDKMSALKNAEKMYGMDNEDISKKEVVNMTDDVQDGLRKDVRKIAFALRDALNEINDLKSQMNKMERNFNNILVNQKPAPRPVQKVVHKPKPEEKRQEAPKQEEQVQTKFGKTSKKIENPIDRNNVAPSDVAIDKMFYFGQK